MTSASIPFLYWLLVIAGACWAVHFVVTAGQRQYRSVPWPGKVCRCHHGSDLHTHYRRGSDCGLCDCRSFVAGPSCDVTQARAGELPFNVTAYVTDETPLFDQEALADEYEQLCRREAS